MADKRRSESTTLQLPSASMTKRGDGGTPSPLYRPENLSALLGDRTFDVNEATAPWKDWEVRLREDADAKCHV
jgi:hypothetical protein